MQLLSFPKYTRAGASSRYRSYQYLQAIQAAGFDVSTWPLFNDDYLTKKYVTGRFSLAGVFYAYARRIWKVLTVRADSIVVIEYELLPYCPALLERWLAWRNCIMLVDYDDAIFHQYDAHRNSWVRSLLSRKISKVMELSKTVVAGNAYLANYARSAGAKRVEVIPTVIDLARYRIKEEVSNSPVFTIGWIGSPSTARYLEAIAPALAQICKDSLTRVCLVGSGHIHLPGVPLEVINWRDDSEVDEICNFDVGIMPLPDEPWARGKCGFKLIQYMACGLPVVASPIGVNSEIVANGVNGYLANTTGEWVQALKTLQQDAGLRHKMGAAGRQKVENKYCLAVTAPKFIEILEQCVA